MKKRIYIAGCGGMLGEAFYKYFGEAYDLECSDIDVNEAWLNFLDFRDLDAYRHAVRSFRADYLFHVGAYTDMEYCELNVDATYATNTMAVENAVLIANALNIPLLYISTSAVFDGRNDSYDDWAAPNPMGHYARSKYMGERFVVENADQYLVCRAGWMMGGGPRKDKKFVHMIMRQLKDGKRTLHIVNDKSGTPTYTHDFVRQVWRLLEAELWGLYNIVCEGMTSRLEFARELIEILSLTDDVTIVEVESDHFKGAYSAERPASERLVNKKLTLDFKGAYSAERPASEALVNKKLTLRNLNEMRDWKVALREYIGDYYDGYL